MRGGLRVVLAYSIISLRLLALILCSNCSNTFNKVLMPTWHHTVKLLFANSVHHFSLLKMCHGWSKHFTSRYDPSTPYTPLHPLHPKVPLPLAGRGDCSRGGDVIWGPVQIACSGVKLNEVRPGSSPWWSGRQNLNNQPFISQLSKHVSVYHHGCYWFLI